MKIIKTLLYKFAAVGLPENVPFDIPQVIPTDPKEKAKLEQAIASSMKFLGEGKPSYLYYGYLPEELKNSEHPGIRSIRYGARKFWNNYLRIKPMHYIYVQPIIKELLTPQTMYFIINYYANIIINQIQKNNVNNANFRLGVLPDEIRSKVQDRVVKYLAKSNVQMSNVPNIIRKKVKQLKRKNS